MTGFLLRWFAALVLVMATYNPTRWNFVTWARATWSGDMPMVALLAVVLLIAYVIYLRATLRSIGLVGMALVAALIAALLWVFIDRGLLGTDNPTLLTWVGLVALSFVLGIGLTWSHVRRALSGQADINDGEE